MLCEGLLLYMTWDPLLGQVGELERSMLAALAAQGAQPGLHLRSVKRQCPSQARASLLGWGETACSTACKCAPGRVSAQRAGWRLGDPEPRFSKAVSSPQAQLHLRIC